MVQLNVSHYLTKSFWCMGQSLDSCYDCKYCRLRDGSTNDFNIMIRPTDVNPILTKIPVVVNIFYGDPLLQIDKTLEIIESLDEAKHQGPVIVITKGDFKKFPRINSGLDLHFAFSTFGMNHDLDGGSIATFVSNLEEAASRRKWRYSIEFRPIICGINDDFATIDRVMTLAKYYSLAVGYSGLQGKPGVVKCWKDTGLNLRPYPGTEFGYKKYISKEVEKHIRSYGVPVFKKTSCLISYTHGLERDYNAHYYRPNELECSDCAMYSKCHWFYRRLPSSARPLPELPFEYRIVYGVNRVCPWLHKGCSFPSNDCSSLTGHFIQVNKNNVTTSDVRVIKWLTGMTVESDFVESPFLSDYWMSK